jgi:hypothetical protein
MREEEQYDTNNLQEPSFYWDWIYPMLLCIGWGFVLGLLMGMFQGSGPQSSLFSMAIGGSMLSVILFIMYETPFNKIIQLLVKIPFVWIIFIIPLLMYWVFVWPISIIDKIIGKIIEKNHTTNLDSKSLKGLKKKEFN